MKQNILFMIINMNIGGTEKALLNMIDEINKNEYEVTLLMLEQFGGFLNEIPKWVNVKYVKNYSDIKDIYIQSPIKVLKQYIKTGNFIKGFNIGFTHLIYKLTNNRSLYFKYILKDCDGLKEEYDIAVAYAGPMDLISYYVINKINAKKKIQWIHFDVTKISFDKNFVKKLYSKFDKVFVVSKEAKEKLDNLIPCLSLKTEVFHNIVSKNKIHKMAELGEGFEDDFEGTRILTVGRLSEEKGQDMIMPVVAKLKEQGYKIRWYIVGEGSLRDKCEASIKKYNLENDVVLLGSISNPYGYMRECDLYVQTSIHEGYCITLVEAKILYKPIVTTNFISAKEHINNNVNGLIVDINLDELYIGIKRILDDSELKLRFKSRLMKEI